MKKKFPSPVALLSVLVFIFFSCSKQSANETLISQPTESINATVSANGVYQLNLDKTSTVNISKQASHFESSKTELDSKTGLLVYRYVPAQNYIGSDEVVLANTKFITRSDNIGCNNGNSHNNSTVTVSSTSYISVKINVTK